MLRVCTQGLRRQCPRRRRNAVASRGSSTSPRTATTSRTLLPAPFVSVPGLCFTMLGLGPPQALMRASACPPLLASSFSLVNRRPVPAPPCPGPHPHLTRRARVVVAAPRTAPRRQVRTRPQAARRTLASTAATIAATGRPTSATAPGRPTSASVPRSSTAGAHGAGAPASTTVRRHLVAPRARREGKED
jgi:hypothetical protein